MDVLSAVTAALKDEPGEPWERELILSLAAAMDTNPNASIAKELRSAMADIGVTEGVPAKKGDVVDDLDAKRAARRAASAATGS